MSFFRATDWIDENNAKKEHVYGHFSILAHPLHITQGRTSCLNVCRQIDRSEIQQGTEASFKF